MSKYFVPDEPGTSGRIGFVSDKGPSAHSRGDILPLYKEDGLRSLRTKYWVTGPTDDRNPQHLQVIRKVLASHSQILASHSNYSQVTRKLLACKSQMTRRFSSAPPIRLSVHLIVPNLDDMHAKALESERLVIIADPKSVLMSNSLDAASSLSCSSTPSAQATLYGPALSLIDIVAVALAVDGLKHALEEIIRRLKCMEGEWDLDRDLGQGGADRGSSHLDFVPQASQLIGIFRSETENFRNSIKAGANAGNNTNIALAKTSDSAKLAAVIGGVVFLTIVATLILRRWKGRSTYPSPSNPVPSPESQMCYVDPIIPTSMTPEKTSDVTVREASSQEGELTGSVRRSCNSEIKRIPSRSTKRRPVATHPILLIKETEDRSTGEEEDYVPQPLRSGRKVKRKSQRPLDRVDNSMTHIQGLGSASNSPICLPGGHFPHHASYCPICGYPFAPPYGSPDGSSSDSYNDLGSPMYPTNPLLVPHCNPYHPTHVHPYPLPMGPYGCTIGGPGTNVNSGVGNVTQSRSSYSYPANTRQRRERELRSVLTLSMHVKCVIILTGDAMKEFYV
ncbi:hypothetical protein BYT27DRAFT_7341986 [Phlegmacium glaucopus]|nr:hypothetical protein BYT27DRAFT_7341986 [Phlegmacium glaucopus]